MKRNGDKFTLLYQVLPDAFLSVAFWILTYFIRFNLGLEAEGGLERRFLKASVLIVVATVYFFRREGLYKLYAFKSRRQEFLAVLNANLMAVTGFVVLLYFLAPSRLSRSVILGYYLISSGGFIFYRMLLRGYSAWLHRRGKLIRSVLLLGQGRAIEHFIENMKHSPEGGVRFEGWADSEGRAEAAGIISLEGDLSNFIRRTQPDLIVINYEGDAATRLPERLSQLHNDVIPIAILPDFTYSFLGYHTTNFADLPAMILNEPSYNIWSVVTKRIFDFVLSLLGLIVISPLLALLAIGVRLSSRGPIFFYQDRIGLDGSKFKMWKFRTMLVGSDVVEGKPGWTTKDDKRCTRFGSFLRATSMDELPQLWNVVTGDMSLVGPRPEQPFYVNKFREEIPAYMLRHKVKSGITGWAQINGWRGDTSLHKRIECDLYYIRNWSIGFDLKILFLTFWKGVVSKNAY